MNLAATNYDVVIAGAGPAGTSAAIELVNGGAAVLLIERSRFPRPKLCGEFISPECWSHFTRLGVAAQIEASGGSTLKRAAFYSRRGNSINVPTTWFSSGETAMGLSRATMDHQLLLRARECGVTVIEDAQVSGLLTGDGIVSGVSIRSNGTQQEVTSKVTIDATGRGRSLSRRFEKSSKRRSSHVAFKAHLSNTHVDGSTCEIYSYSGGYGGLNAVEGELSNLCFIVSAKDARAHDSDPEKLVRHVLCQNARASYVLNNARTETAWLAVPLENLGRHEPAPADGLLAAGDAASFIDPFTGSGMLMALESGAVVAMTVSSQLQHLNGPASYRKLTNDYREIYHRTFASRLRFCGWLRRVSFVPQLAELVMLVCGNDSLRERITRATRKSNAASPGLSSITS